MGRNLVILGVVIWRRGQTTIYLPIVTCLVISIVLSLIMTIFRR